MPASASTQADQEGSRYSTLEVDPNPGTRVSTPVHEYVQFVLYEPPYTLLFLPGMLELRRLDTLYASFMLSAQHLIEYKQGVMEYKLGIMEYKLGIIEYIVN